MIVVGPVFCANRRIYALFASSIKVRDYKDKNYTHKTGNPEKNVKVYCDLFVELDNPLLEDVIQLYNSAE